MDFAPELKGNNMSNSYNEKLQRMETAINLGVPDRVPFAPKVSLYPCFTYGPSVYDVMKDYRNAAPAIRSYIRDLDPDLAWSPPTYPIDPLEALGTNMLRWPGPTHKLPLMSSYQHLDNTYMEDDEFDEFLTDPTHFIITKLLPRKHNNLKGLSKLTFHDIFDMSFIMDTAAFGDPEVMSALMALMHAGQHVRDKIEQAKFITNLIVNECGCPTRGATVCAPFDIYTDSLRGLVQGVMDVKLYPEETLACVNRIADMCIAKPIAAAKAKGERLVYIPLHSGTDDFMSGEDYETFYWPTLRRLIMAIIDAGMTPYVFCEGKYNTRLDVISDVPRGKVVYMFEQVDIRRAKETVGKVACIGGNLPTSLLAFGTKEQVVDETRRLLDICAPGGGFIMDCSLAIDNANPENMLAWREATEKYGTY
ncbi:MAG: hypothetical protein IJP23_02555 [Oscillospiraceae bacterium]|nr:hypothetical protein [Oscillospiraceae bacterium]